MTGEFIPIGATVAQLLTRPNRLLDMENLMPLRRRRHAPGKPLAVLQAAEDAAPAEAVVEVRLFRRPPDLTPRDWAVYLLRRAAQIEHALMVQYLFAAYSLKSDVPVGPSSTTKWQAVLKQVAKEEMGHLLIVQNLLRLLGGPLSFEREEFPAANELYPFPFQLERLTKDSLAKYVFAEMSDKPLPEGVITPAKRKEIEERARKAAQVPAGVSFINHVGTLYDTLLYVFETELKEGPEGDFRTDRNDWLAGKPQFRGTNETTVNPDGTLHLARIKALAPKTKAETLVALRIIGQQGEAADEPHDDVESHFERFLELYELCPEDASGLTYPVVTNPNTRVTAADAGTLPAGKVRLWALLFNVRYRILLTALAHALAMPAVHAGAPTLRETLIGWVYEEMTDTSSTLRDLAEHLVALPLAEGATQHAGPPFEVPYALDLPDQAPERWRLHLDLLGSSQALVKQLRQAGETGPILDDLDIRDTARRIEITTGLQTSGF